MDQNSSPTDIYVYMVVSLEYNDLVTEINRKTTTTSKQPTHAYSQSSVTAPCKKQFLYFSHLMYQILKIKLNTQNSHRCN